jgi:hypothetical protein
MRKKLIWIAWIFFLLIISNGCADRPFGYLNLFNATSESRSDEEKKADEKKTKQLTIDAIAHSYSLTRTAHYAPSPTRTSTKTKLPKPIVTIKSTKKTTPIPSATKSYPKSPTFTKSIKPTYTHSGLIKDVSVEIINGIDTTIQVSCSGPIEFKEVVARSIQKIIYIPSGTYQCTTTAIGYYPLIDTKTWTSGEWDWEFFDNYFFLLR